jgi:hypothetical protein
MTDFHFCGSHFPDDSAGNKTRMRADNELPERTVDMERLADISG